MKIPFRCSATVNSRQADFRIKLIHWERVEILLGNSVFFFLPVSTVKVLQESVKPRRKDAIKTDIWGVGGEEVLIRLAENTVEWQVLQRTASYEMGDFLSN
jgi:hypothetical protein